MPLPAKEMLLSAVPPMAVLARCKAALALSPGMLAQAASRAATDTTNAGQPNVVQRWCCMVFPSFLNHPALNGADKSWTRVRSGQPRENTLRPSLTPGTFLFPGFLSLLFVSFCGTPGIVQMHRLG